MSRRRSATDPVLWLTILPLAALLFATSARAQALRDASQIKSEFIHNFLKFVEWPVATFSSLDDPLVVAIVGSGPTADATERFLATKRVGTRPLVVRRMTWDESRSGVHAVFVGESDPTTQRHFLEQTGEEGILSIGETDGFVKRGGVIGMSVVDNKVRFDINRNAAKAARLKVSARLLALARGEPR